MLRATLIAPKAIPIIVIFIGGKSFLYKITTRIEETTNPPITLERNKLILLKLIIPATTKALKKLAPPPTPKI